MAYTSNFKTPYIYFGRKGYLAEVSAADQEVAGGSATSLVATGVAYNHATLAGFLPKDHTAGISNTSTSTDGYRIVIKAAAGTTGDRGAAYTKDFVTGLDFTAAANPAAGDVTELNAAGWDVANSQQITVVGAGGTAFYDIQNTDLLWVEQTAVLASAALPVGTITSSICLPMKNLIGVDTISYALSHYDGTALDRSILSFKSTVGSATDDTIVLTHTAGKYKELCAALEVIANSNDYNKATTFFDLNAAGTETHFDPTLGIVGCFIDSAAK